MFALIAVLLCAEPPSFRYEPLPTGGVAVIDSSGRTTTVLLPQSPVASVFVQGRTLVVIEARQLATLFDLSDPSAPKPTSPVAATPPVAAPSEPPSSSPSAAPVSPPPTPTTARATGKVVSVQSGRVLFELGAGTLEPRAHVRIVSQRPVLKPDLVTGVPRLMPSNETTAVVAVEEVQGNRGMAVIGRGDFAEPDDLVVATDEPLSERLMVPRRSPFAFRFGFALRPFLGLETNVNGATSKPVGVLLDAYAAYYVPNVPIAVELSVAPFGAAINALDAHYATVVALTGAYSTDYFEIGLGVGGLFGNQGPCAVDALGARTCERNNGFTINQVLRLGALDGLSLTWRSSIFSRPDRFVFGVGRAELNVPLTSRLGLFGGGGAGENGWLLGELGVRTYVGGTGARGTMVLSASLGYAAVFDGPLGERAGGPAVAIGIEWRR